MSKVGADAAMRDYLVKPRLEYRTLQGVNGPLVILENVRQPKFAVILRVQCGQKLLDIDLAVDRVDELVERVG